MATVKDKVIQFIETFQIAYPGVSPSYREILDGVGRSSTGSLGAVIERMEANGDLEKYDSGSSRSILLPNTVLLTREMAEQMGLDWHKLEAIRDNARQKISPQVAPTYAGYAHSKKVTA